MLNFVVALNPIVSSPIANVIQPKGLVINIAFVSIAITIILMWFIQENIKNSRDAIVPNLTVRGTIVNVIVKVVILFRSEVFRRMQMQ